MSNKPLHETQSLGGKANAIIQRKIAIEKYYNNPNICKYCGKIIEVKENEKIPEVRRRKFCNQQCNGKYKKLNNINKENTLKRKSGAIPLIEYRNKISILNKTKGQLFNERTTWQSARSAIQKSARSIYFKYAPNSHCCAKNCKYSLHVDVAHIKAVNEFNNSTLIYEINTPSNLIGLCKIHHWEYDNGYLDLKNIEKNS